MNAKNVWKSLIAARMENDHTIIHCIWIQCNTEYTVIVTFFYWIIEQFIKKQSNPNYHCTETRLYNIAWHYTIKSILLHVTVNFNLINWHKCNVPILCNCLFVCVCALLYHFYHWHCLAKMDNVIVLVVVFLHLNHKLICQKKERYWVFQKPISKSE